MRIRLTSLQKTHRLQPNAVALICVLFGLVACTSPSHLDVSAVNLGDFHLGHNAVVAPNLTQGSFSRDATQEEWIEEVSRAIDAQFRRYQGSHLYHLGVSVEGYVLAVPGIPVVAAPKSVLIVRVTAWDDAAGRKLNEEAHVITVVESVSLKTLWSSGRTQTREQQMTKLAKEAAQQIENWLIEQHTENGWFTARAPVVEGI